MASNTCVSLHSLALLWGRLRVHICCSNLLIDSIPTTCGLSIALRHIYSLFWWWVYAVENVSCRKGTKWTTYGLHVDVKRPIISNIPTRMKYQLSVVIPVEIRAWKGTKGEKYELCFLLCPPSSRQTSREQWTRWHALYWIWQYISDISNSLLLYLR